MIDWSEETYDKYFDKLTDTTETEREYLDLICGAVNQYAAKHNSGAYCSPNRLFALAVVDLYKEWNDMVMNRE